MIGETIGILNSWIKDFGMLSEGWRAAILIFVLVFGTAVVAFIASRVIGVLEQKFSSTRNLWDDASIARRP